MTIERPAGSDKIYTAKDLNIEFGNNNCAVNPNTMV